MQFFSGLNLWAVLVAAGASFLFGGLWYGGLSKVWMQAAGLTEDRLKGPGGPSPIPFVITFVAQTIMACMLAGLIGHMAKAGLPANIKNGLITAFLIWLGFILTIIPAVTRTCPQTKFRHIFVGSVRISHQWEAAKHQLRDGYVWPGSAERQRADRRAGHDADGPVAGRRKDRPGEAERPQIRDHVQLRR